MSTKKPDLKSQRWAVERLHIEEMRLRDELSNLHEQQRTLAEEYVKAIRREIRKQVKVRLSMVDYTAFSPVSMIWNTKHGGCVWLGVHLDGQIQVTISHYSEGPFNRNKWLKSPEAAVCQFVEWVKKCKESEGK